MRSTLGKLLVSAGLVIASLQAVAQTTQLQNYVSQCKTSLGFKDADVPAQMDCYDGVLFDTEPPAHDYVIYKKVTDQVDLTLACRWVGGSKSDRRTSISIEMMLHNRQNGNTCVFSGKEVVQFQVPTLIVGPTAPNASNYWKSPSDIDTGVGPRCVGCHVSGPYLSTPKIAPVLAKFGLLNNGHDTLSNMTNEDLKNQNPNVHAKFHYLPLGSVFSTWDSERNKNVETSISGCSIGCHLIGTNSPQGDIGVAPGGTILTGPDHYVQKVLDAGVMEPYGYDSDYRWINLDTAGDGVEAESFASAINATSLLVPRVALPSRFDGSFCPTGNVPTDMEVHAVGTNVENSFSYSGVSYFSEKLRSFNLKDGLVCLNSDQDPGVTCRDFDVSYLCPDNVTWTGFYNHTVNSGGGDDHEERSSVNSQVLAACGGAQPIGIRARIFLATRGGPSPQIVNGPNDRLARLSPYGITCNNSDQPDGQCSNYVVRYQGCGDKPLTATRHLTNVFTGKQLTATSSTANAPVQGVVAAGKAVQQWSIEPVVNTEYVRLKNVSTNTYLNVTSSTEGAGVVTSAGSNAASQRWIVESVVYSPSDFRLRNLGTGKYLTSQDPALATDKTHLAIYSQGKNPGWTSQRWVIN